ncbi:interleukin-17C-like [Clavelina lepadiformis]|uniref:interleukin-17C-like n=1 Tax=Clavelina lepadiformis TaxID=159417 RepID=UPI004041688A
MDFVIVAGLIILISQSVCVKSQQGQTTVVAKFEEYDILPIRKYCPFDPDIDIEYDKITRCMQNNKIFSDHIETRDHTGLLPAYIPPRMCTKDPVWLDKSKTEVSRLSLSPWKWVKNTDENRVPRQVLEAECLCNSCLDEDGKEMDGVTSVSVKVPYRVTKYDRGGKAVVTYVNIAIGCTCRFPEYISE